MNCDIPSKTDDGAIEILLIDIKDLSRMIGERPKQIYRMIATGKLPYAMQHKRGLRWRKKEIEAWVEEGCPSPERWQWKLKKK